jgi:predicted metal-dependent peptidase
MTVQTVGTSKPGRHQCEELRKARILACQKWPYATYMILTLMAVENPRLPGPVACDSTWRLHFNPEHLKAARTDDVAGMILRDVARLLFRHPKRGAQILGGSPSKSALQRVQLASELAANSNLLASGVNLPEGSHKPEDYSLDAEETLDYYDYELRKLMPDQPDPQDGDGDQEGDGQGEPSQGKPGQGKGKFDPALAGSAADGIPKEWEQHGTEEGDAEPGSDGRHGLDEAEQEIIRREIAERILDHEKKVGKLSARTRAWARELIDPKVDPRTILRRAVRHHVEVTQGTGDYSYRRPNRRNPRPDILLPSNVQPVPRVTIIVDTSGSMDHSDISLSLGMIGQVLEAYRVRDGIKVVCADTSAASVQQVLRPETLEIHGGGGTDMSRAIIQAATDEDILRGGKGGRKRPQVILVCTDGYTGWPSQDVGIPVVACLTRPRSGDIPKWIQVVEMFQGREAG